MMLSTRPLPGKRLLLIDCEMREFGGHIGRSDYAERTLIRRTERYGVGIDRVVLLEEPAAHRRIQSVFPRQTGPGRYRGRGPWLCDGIIISGSNQIHPMDDRHPLVLHGQRKSDRRTSALYNRAVLAIIDQCAERGIPLFGICYGHQMIARYVGEEVSALPQYECGFSGVVLTWAGQANPLFAGMPAWFLAAQDYGMGVMEATRLQVLAQNDRGIQAAGVPGTPIVGVQFHPEAQPTDRIPAATPNEKWTYRINERPLLNFIDRACFSPE